MAKSNHITITKSARYFTLGEWNDATKEVWFVLHGYAQLASDFIADFEVLNNGTRFIVAPEGLNRFYAKGFGGKPAASWMTSEDREHEINDYLAYLDALYASLNIPANIKVVVFGFSQGVTTASRFIHHTLYKTDEFIAYAGEIAKELTEPISAKIKVIKTTYITGNNDPFITPEKQERVYALMHQLSAKMIEFEGGHEVKKEVLLKLDAVTG